MRSLCRVSYRTSPSACTSTSPTAVQFIRNCAAALSPECTCHVRRDDNLRQRYLSRSYRPVLADRGRTASGTFFTPLLWVSAHAQRPARALSLGVAAPPVGG